MDTLLTFTGYHDPYALGVMEDDEQLGPILTVVTQRCFDSVVLFSTPGMRENTQKTREALRTRFPRIAVDVRDVPLADPTDYNAILTAMRRELADLQESFSDAEFYVSVASGTPQIHACWLVLLREDRFPARLLQVRPPRFVTDESPPISELDVNNLFLPLINSGPDKVGRIGSKSSKALPRAISEPPNIPLRVACARIGIVGEHPLMVDVLERVQIAAASTLAVLLIGETGTGKELLAQLIHMLSDRATGPFVPLNCGAIPRDLVESTLFGHVKGAFTGAVRDQPGKFDAADGGTLFLDEVGELPLDIQVKLLRVLDDGMVHPIGAKDAKKVNVRVVAATNRDLLERIADKEFREDLYYRLASVELRLPPLRERTSDIPRIALHLLDTINKQLRSPKRMAREALSKLQQHPWPGNVRDLYNVLSQSCLFSRGELIEAEDLVLSRGQAPPAALNTLPDPHEGFCVKSFLGDARKWFFTRAVEISGGNKSEAARLLGVSPQAVQKFFEAERSTDRWE